MSRRRLVVMRHAKSSWTVGMGPDHARPLNARGLRDAPRIAAELQRRGWVPEQVVSSDAARTKETWARMETVLGDQIPVSWSPGLYRAALAAFPEELGLVADELSTVLVLGHNPDLEEIIFGLAGEDIRLTTANAVLLEGEGAGWAEALSRGRWALVDVIRPKELG